MLLGAKLFLRILRLPLRLRSGLAAKAGMHSTSSAFRRTAQTPYKLNFGSGPSTALRAPTRGARLRLLQTPAKRLNFATRVGDGDHRCTLGTRVISGSAKNAKRETTVESHSSRNEGWGTRLLGCGEGVLNNSLNLRLSNIKIVIADREDWVILSLAPRKLLIQTSQSLEDAG